VSDDCEYCLDASAPEPGPYCDAEDPETGFVCTRETGHDGPHVACIPAIPVDPAEHEVAEWKPHEVVSA
jgi:hypothetical protein